MHGPTDAERGRESATGCGRSLGCTPSRPETDVDGREAREPDRARPHTEPRTRQRSPQAEARAIARGRRDRPARSATPSSRSSRASARRRARRHRAARRGPPAGRGRARASARRCWPRRSAASIDCSVRRIQFTPDLLPSDITGVSVYNQNTREFEFKPGAIFANIVVGDEINRASPKTQSALLECMEERQVTVDGTTYQLDAAVHGHRHAEPDRDGRHLPAARGAARPLHGADRRWATRSATPSCEMLDIARRREPLDDLEPVSDALEVARADRARTARSTSRPSVRRYAVDLVTATRNSSRPAARAPRRGRRCTCCAPAAPSAALDERDYVLPDDLQRWPSRCLPHRLAALRRSADRAPARRPTVLADILAARRRCRPPARAARGELTADARPLSRPLTIRGRCLLAAGVAAACPGSCSSETDLLRVGVLLLRAAASLPRRRRAHPVPPDVRRAALEPARIAAGERSRAVLRIENSRGSPPALLLLEDTFPTSSAAGRASSRAARAAAPGRRRLPGPRRGARALSRRSADGAAADPFGLCELPRAFTTTDTLVVTPPVVALPDPARGEWAVAGESTAASVSTHGRRRRRDRANTATATTCAGSTGAPPRAAASSRCAARSSPGRAAARFCSTPGRRAPRRRTGLVLRVGGRAAASSRIATSPATASTCGWSPTPATRSPVTPQKQWPGRRSRAFSSTRSRS